MHVERASDLDLGSSLRNCSNSNNINSIDPLRHTQHHTKPSQNPSPRNHLQSYCGQRKIQMTTMSINCNRISKCLLLRACQR
mmetsp:Transcript_108125/g.302871  ORF Transcript_108125/g.302871 Transcript_108125/m.302871 type:complete len:82 (+) Transcript_108125:242-487(+)